MIAKVVALNLFATFFVSFFPYIDSHIIIALLSIATAKVVALSLSYRKSRKSDNYLERNTEKK